MELSEKIKAARLEAGLSQRQLCGDVITRNMLSQIENGSARPSMQTLRYLAQQLKKPVSYFLDEEAVLLPNRGCIEQARLAFARGDAAAARQALESFQEPDAFLGAEHQLLLFLTGLSLAQQALQKGQTPYAITLLQQLEQVDSIYITRQLEQERLQLLAQAGVPVALPAIDDALYLRAQAALNNRSPRRAMALLNAMQEQTAPRWALLCGDAAFQLENYQEAAAAYRKAEAEYPELTVRKLEICYRELGDYKRAYEYAKKQ